MNSHGWFHGDIIIPENQQGSGNGIVQKGPPGRNWPNKVRHESLQIIYARIPLASLAVV